MAKTSAEFLKDIRASGYPRSLTDQNIQAAFDLAVIDMGLASPAIKAGSFTAVSGQDVYDVFNRNSSNPAPAELIDPRGLRVYDVVWSIQGSSTSDPFYQGPGFGPYNGRPVLPFTVSTGRAADSIIFELDTEAITDEFFAAGWEHVDGDPGSPIRLLPVPAQIYTVGVRYSAYRSQEECLARADLAYGLFAEARCCRTVARYAGVVAGTKMGTFEDTGKSADFWNKEANRLYSEAERALQLVGFAQIAAVARGGSIS